MLSLICCVQLVVVFVAAAAETSKSRFEYPKFLTDYYIARLTSGVSFRQRHAVEIANLLSDPRNETAKNALTTLFLDDNEFVSSEAVLLIGDERGILLTVAKGGFDENRQTGLASASKLLTALTFVRFLESDEAKEVRFTLDSRVNEFVPWWPTNVTDGRSRITLRHLLSLTSGYHGDVDADCMNWLTARDSSTLEECVKDQIFADPDAFEWPPGKVFSYGSVHMQIAGVMLRYATGTSWQETFYTHLLKPLGLSSANVTWDLFTKDRPMLAGGATTSAAVYARILTQLYTNRNFVSQASLDALFGDQTANVTLFEYTPSRETGNVIWRYGLGAWIECNTTDAAGPLPMACVGDKVYSSLGAYGFYPVINLKDKYWMIVGQNFAETYFNRLAPWAVALIVLFVLCKIGCIISCIVVCVSRRRRRRLGENSSTPKKNDGKYKPVVDEDEESELKK